jgi:hypothetical protein
MLERAERENIILFEDERPVMKAERGEGCPCRS